MQMFALRQGPPMRVGVAGCQYVLSRVFKHDFWAATCLYELDGPAPRSPQPPTPRIVVKFGRDHAFCGLPVELLGRWLAGHERAIYARLAGVEGLPRCLGPVGRNGIAIEYVEASPLDHLNEIPPGLFDRLRETLDEIHARDVAYCDANKRSNILVAAGARPVLVDFQIAIATRDDLPWPIGTLIRTAVRYMAAKDIYHLCKHKRKLAPDQLTPQEQRLAEKPRGLHWVHRKLTKPYRWLRRRFLRAQYDKGALVSPSAELEDHRQPEKDTWRKPGTDRAGPGGA